MIKMFKAEVLGKLPVAQHFLFGTLLPFPPSSELENLKSDQDDVVVDEAGHVHLKGQLGWGECCGIPIPSSFAAVQDQRNFNLIGTSIKRIPFD